MPRSILAAVAAAFSLAAVGCGGSNVGTVSGTVLADGQPLKEGLIRFEPTNRTDSPIDAPITDGKYSVTLAPGDAKVSVRANKVVGKKKMYDTPDSPTVDKVVELVDAQFNDNSKLQITVTLGQQQKDWEVKKRK